MLSIHLFPQGLLLSKNFWNFSYESVRSYTDIFRSMSTPSTNFTAGMNFLFRKLKKIYGFGQVSMVRFSLTQTCIWLIEWLILRVSQTFKCYFMSWDKKSRSLNVQILIFAHLLGLVLWHINYCRSFHAKFISIHVNSSISNNSV